MSNEQNQSTESFPTVYELPFWKPYQGKGAAFIVEASLRGIFFTFMPEGPGEKEFNPTRKVVFKVGAPDVAEMLAVLGGFKEAAGPLDKDGKPKGLYHKNSKGNCIFQMQYNAEKNGFYVSVSQDKEGDKNRIGLGISQPEGILLAEFLKAVMLNALFLREPWSKGEQEQGNNDAPAKPEPAKTGKTAAKTSVGTTSVPKTTKTPVPIDTGDDIPF